MLSPGDLSGIWGLCRSQGAWCPTVNFSGRLTRPSQERCLIMGRLPWREQGPRRGKSAAWFYRVLSIPTFPGWLGLTRAARAAGTDLESRCPSVHPSAPTCNGRAWAVSSRVQGAHPSQGTGHLPKGAHRGFPELCFHFQAEDPVKDFI